MAAAGNNRFAVTFGLLRQYISENQHQQSQQQTGGLPGSFLLPPPQEGMEEAEETADARTMQLFPTQAGTSSRPSHKRAEEQATPPLPLTILYRGRVLVFEDFPADKAKELIQMAGSGSLPVKELKNEVPAVPEMPATTEPLSFSSDLPIARKASLKRFLQKRKHRIIATDPYDNHNKEAPTGNEAAERKLVNGEPAAPWLAL